ncbi:MAG: DUF1194 domain-containing protein [Pseudomonadota bacterium]
MFRTAFFAILVLLGLQPAHAQSCRQALVLALDVSLSVDPNDFVLQREGLSSALLDPSVQAAMLRGPDHMELAVFEWSGSFDQQLIVDWTVIDSPATLQQIALTLLSSQQQTRSGRTALGAALTYARDLLLARGHCETLTLDVSGDGVNNSGIRPETVKDDLDALGIGVNALVIEASPEQQFEDQPSVGQLAEYFHDNVIVGPSSFVEVIIGFSAYEKAIRRKLLRELVPSMVQAPGAVPVTMTASGPRRDLAMAAMRGQPRRFSR